jgi:predicted nucleic acid-binding protein
MATGMSADASSVLLLDTSTAIALVTEDHESHATTLAAVRGHRLGLAGHAWFETYSVLTRLPGALRRTPEDALRMLAHNFPNSRFIDEAAASALGAELAALRITGGSVYDALVGACARHHELPLASNDSRAQRIYEALGVALVVI